MLSINTDAHSTDGFEEMIFGVNVARRAWVTKANVINCLSLTQLETWIAKKR
jgi:DNA polymerase (family 10)